MNRFSYMIVLRGKTPSKASISRDADDGSLPRVQLNFIWYLMKRFSYASSARPSYIASVVAIR